MFIEGTFKLKRKEVIVLISSLKTAIKVNKNKNNDEKQKLLDGFEEAIKGGKIKC